MPGQRHEPPAELTEEQAEVWRAIVATKPATWWGPDTYPLLVEYCAHVTTARGLAIRINTFTVASLAKDDTLMRYQKLLQMRERESKTMLALARAMRLTQQSQLKAEKAATQAQSVGGMRKPWEVA